MKNYFKKLLMRLFDTLSLIIAFLLSIILCIPFFVFWICTGIEIGDFLFDWYHNIKDYLFGEEL